MKILLIEDERKLADAVAQILKRSKFDVDVAYNGNLGLDFALTGVYDAVLLDILLPELDGIEVLRRMRARGVSTPVILLTALAEVEDRVYGLDAGADDYLPKPFKSEELIARIKAVTRRKGEYYHDGILTFGDIEYNPLTYELACKNNRYTLTRKEGRILEYLIENKNIRLSSSAIIEKVWGFDTDAEDSNIHVYISFLRKKLSLLGSGVGIGNIREVGYTLTWTPT